MWNGKYLRDLYPYATRWQVFKFKTIKVVKALIKMTVFAGITTGMIYGAYAYGEMNRETIIEVKETNNLPNKIKEFKSDFLATLKTCESGGKTEDDAPMILDTNNKMSIGLYMFQIDTVIHYYKTLYGKDVTRKEAVEIALDEEKAGKLAHDIIFTTEKGPREWVNCFKKHGLVEDLKVIEKLES